jgi:hypothetical protein
VLALANAKILDNMEIGHNVMHGQYDWTGDPALNSQTFEWDIACDGEQWRHSHNVTHHTYTNILGKDRDLGYSLLRMTDEQKLEAAPLVPAAGQPDAGHGVPVRRGFTRPGDWQIQTRRHAQGRIQGTGDRFLHQNGQGLVQGLPAVPGAGACGVRRGCWPATSAPT